MKNFAKIAAIFLLFSLFVTIGIAQTENQSQSNSSCMGMGAMHQSMMGKMTDEQKDQHIRAKQNHMLKMHDLSNQILAAKDPKEQQKLKQQQFELMKRKMAKMKERMAQSMQNCSMNKPNQGQIMMYGK